MINSSQSARANILAKLKQQVQGADYTQLPKEESFTYPTLSQTEMLEQFIAHLSANQAKVIQLNEQDIAQTVVNELAERKLNTLLCGQNSPFSADISALNADITLDSYDFDLDNNKEKLFNHYPASITGSYGAIAQTGSIILWPSKAEPRTLSLVPPVHFVVVDAKKMLPTFAAVMTKHQWNNKLPTNVVLVSGPSKTADIQQTLAYGAHGPKALIVLLINSESPHD